MADKGSRGSSEGLAKLPPRGDDLSKQPKFQKTLRKLFDRIFQGFQDKNIRNEATERYWRLYNCELTANQTYQGNSQVFLPFIHDAIEARVQRYINTLFPETGRYVDLVSHPNDYPHGLIALMDGYVKKADLRSKLRSLLRNGEVEGQYSLYVDWVDTTRYITKKVEKHPEIEKGLYDPNETFMDIEEDSIKEGHPRVEVIMDADLLLLPNTMDDIEEEDDPIVVIRRFFTEEGLDQAAKNGWLSKDAVNAAKKQIKDYDPTQVRNTKKQLVSAAGVDFKANKLCYILLETWRKYTIDGRRRWTQIFFGGDALCFGMYVNPFWNDRCPLLSKARQKLDGSVWGKSPCDAVEQMQYAANDFVNMAVDNGVMSVNRIYTTDPEKNPQYANLVIAPGAVWPVAPQDIKALEQDQLWKEAMGIVDQFQSKIMASFGLNPAMITMGAGQQGRKPSQAQVAQEQMVTIASITDEVLTLEDALLTPLLEMFFELDQQFRDEDEMVRIFGQEGIAAKMEKVPPFAWDERYCFMWRGSQVMRSQQANQQMISGLAVLGKLGPMLPNGKKIDISPIIETFVENVYGPRLGARVLVDQRDQLEVPPELENQIMMGGMMAEVHPLDNDPAHMQVHAAAIKQTGDPNGLLRVHLQKHQMQMAAKTQAAQGGQPSQQQPGGARPGAQAMPPRGAQQPAGAMHKDRMRDPGMMPRKAIGMVG